MRVDEDATSPNAVAAIWRGQNQCVSEDFSGSKEAPSNASEIIIKHQLKGGRGHFSVLDQAFVVMAVSGAPHEAIAQLTRHHENKFLVQSGRYSGERFLNVADGKTEPREAFYHDPIGTYQDREGKRFEINQHHLNDYDTDCQVACAKYAYYVRELGYSYESARSRIPYNFRQNFQISGRLRDWWHLLDQRTKGDAQLSTRALSLMFHEALFSVSAELQQWYEDERLGRARLAP